MGVGWFMLLIVTLTVGGLLTILFLHDIYNTPLVVSAVILWHPDSIYTLHPKRDTLRLLVKLILELKKKMNIKADCKTAKAICNITPRKWECVECQHLNCSKIYVIIWWLLGTKKLSWSFFHTKCIYNKLICRLWKMFWYFKNDNLSQHIWEEQS